MINLDVLQFLDERFDDPISASKYRDRINFGRLHAAAVKFLERDRDSERSAHKKPAGLDHPPASLHWLLNHN